MRYFTQPLLRICLPFAAAMLMIATFLYPAQAAPEFIMEKVFPGNMIATGSFSAINGVKRSFTVDVISRWNGKRLKIEERFTYDDGEKDVKTWRFTKIGPNKYIGTREDVIGTTTLTTKGNKATFNYSVYLDPKNNAQKVHFYDTMILNDDGTITNRALVTKFGLPVARVKVDFRPAH